MTKYNDKQQRILPHGGYDYIDANGDIKIVKVVGADKKDTSVEKPANNNQFNWVLDLTAEQFSSLAKLQSAMEFFAIGFAIAGFAIGLVVGLAF